MRRELAPVLWGAALLAAALAFLGLGNWPGDLGHALFGDALCGPWG
jgi:hypothetical protein